MKLDKYTVGKRYGKALFELAVEEKAVEQVYQELLVVREIFQEIPDLGDLLTDVRLAEHEKKAVMDQLVESFSQVVKNCLFVVLDYHRSKHLPLIIDEYERRYNRLNKVTTGTVTTAVPISDEQKAQIEAKVASVLGCKQAHLTPVVDQTILGGVIVEVDDQVIDGSLARQLDSLRAALSKK